MRVQWIDEQLEKKGLPRRALSDAIPGMTPVKVSLVMSGKRKLSADEADAIRRFFGYRLPDDPPRSQADELADRLSQLGDHQINAVVLYLEALTGEPIEPRPEAPQAN
jgi:hypothetical protein